MTIADQPISELYTTFIPAMPLLHGHFMLFARAVSSARRFDSQRLNFQLVTREIKRMVRKSRANKKVGATLASWGLLLLIGAGLAGNGFLLFTAARSGNTAGMLVFGACFVVIGIYLYRTYQACDDIRGNFRD